jgi:hypothetical protein
MSGVHAAVASGVSGQSGPRVAALEHLLAALAEDSGASAACLTRACTQLMAKKRLKSGKVAAGMQHMISSAGAFPQQLPTFYHVWLKACLLCCSSTP